jgi:hypothetical protein
MKNKVGRERRQVEKSNEADDQLKAVDLFTVSAALIGSLRNTLAST